MHLGYRSRRRGGLSRRAHGVEASLVEGIGKIIVVVATHW
jgi:hypothetical protein